MRKQQIDCQCVYTKKGCSLSRVKLEDEPRFTDVQSRVVAIMLKDGIAVEPRAASEHYKPEQTVLAGSWY